ncbi:MAG: coproporphyrinogen-III oxidase family protein [Acidobacteriota bacterium]
MTQTAKPVGSTLNSMESEKSLASSTAEERIRDYRELQKAGLICLHDDFMPSVHYPQITMYPPVTQEEFYQGYTCPEENRFVVYVHIPFCKRRCTFCHYPNKFGDHHAEEKDYYLSTLEREMDIYMKLLNIDAINARSILIGGGTPTFLTPKQLDRFLRYFTDRVDLSRSTQFNYDVDPETIIGPEGEERLEIMKRYGVDRLTIGIQSLDPRILKLMNRHHTVEQAIESVKMTQKMGFQLNIEFIYGYPGQTVQDWKDDMERAVALGVDEIQIYRLKVIPYGDQVGTITTQFSKDKSDFVPIEDTLVMKQLAIEILAREGYHENLRRVYSKNPRHFSHYAHDQCCNLFDCLGFGLSAFNSLRDRFSINSQYFKEYYAAIEQGRLPLNRGLVRDADAQRRWSAILPLKNRNIVKRRFQKRNGISVQEVFGHKIEKLKQYGLVYEDEHKIEVTAKGSFFADEVVQSFHHPDFMPFPRDKYADGELNPYLP